MGGMDYVVTHDGAIRAYGVRRSSTFILFYRPLLWADHYNIWPIKILLAISLIPGGYYIRVTGPLQSPTLGV
jgi:hypothetical protein